ncbi:hypothetical protein SPLC1_S360140 [Arthrospira platensis C1]|nr:hypothetical protein SPLC1_S360140 [Arthrospira platensis C1]
MSLKTAKIESQHGINYLTTLSFNCRQYTLKTVETAKMAFG